jgi:predicted methyltransferase
MKKLALALAVTLTLAACGESAPPAEPAAPPAATTAAPPEPVAPPPPADPAAAFAQKLDDVLKASHRSAENKARDVYRHPKETLTFFGLAPGMTVVEITPGGGWYTEILAPLLRDDGKLIATIAKPVAPLSEGTIKYLTNANQKLRDKLAANPELYDQVQLVEFDPLQPSFGEPGSADLVVTFRNVHNWTEWKSDAAMFKAFFDVLKPGGTLGVVEHRAAPGTDAATSAETGYIAEDYVIKLATDAGFEMVEKSEINANPADTRDHPKGVWTLPPSLVLGEQDKAKYLGIGESDRMTLKFRKPGGDAAPAADAAAPDAATPDAAKAEPAEQPAGG